MNEINSQETKLGGTLLSPYIPPRPDVSWLVRLCWRCTRHGRARLNLWLAKKCPDSVSIRNALAGRLAGLLENQGNGNPKHKVVACDILLYLTWTSLQTGALEDGMRHLAELDRWFAASTERLALRWNLLQLLHQGHPEYAKHAGLFLSDPLTVGYGHAVLETLRRVYTYLPLPQRRVLVKSVHISLTKDPRVRAALVQWQCPVVFASRAEADSWVQQSSPECLDFAPEMKADALLAIGRLAEWDRNWPAMEARTREALQVQPDSLEAVFLLTRSRLRQPDRGVPGELKTLTLPDNPKWQRLGHQCNLYDQGGLEQAEALIAALPEAASAGDVLELDLAIKLLEGALTSPAARLPDRVKQCAELSSRLQGLAEMLLTHFPTFKEACKQCRGVFRFPREMADQTTACPHCQKKAKLNIPKTAVTWLPWTEVNLALREIHIDRNFERAFQRLENPELAGFVPASSIAQTARLLAGSPRIPVDNSTVNPALTVLTNALGAVTGPAAPGAVADWSELRDAIRGVLTDPTVREFPPLLAVADILLLAVRVLGGDVTAPGHLLAYAVPSYAPPWAVWLYSRLMEIVSDFSIAETTFRQIPLAGTAVAWFAELWWHGYGIANGKTPILVSDARKRLASDEGLLSRAKLFVGPVRAARLQGYRHPTFAANTTPPGEMFVELGEICRQHCVAELKFEVDFARTRCSLADGEPATAATRLRAAGEVLATISPLADRWWRPLITYWMGVALAHDESASAVAILESLVGGALGNQALGQLALLDLQKGDTSAAACRLQGASERVPAVCYAKAVLLSRTGQAGEACQFLESEETISALAASPYALAARRLLAAISERGGNQAESVRIHNEILTTHPADEISTLRMVRHDLQSAYADFHANGNGTHAEPPCADILAGLAPKSRLGLAQKTTLSMLLDFMSASSPDALAPLTQEVNTHISDPGRRLWWRQLLATGFLRMGDPANAREVLDTLERSDIPPALERSRAILDAWHELVHLTVPERCDEAAARLQQQVRILQHFEAGDSTVRLWRMLAQIAVDLCNGNEVSPNQWGALADSPMSRIPFLFDIDPNTRYATAQALLPALASEPSRWNETQLLLLQALTAYAAENDDAFVEHYTTLEPCLDELPVPGRDLWVAAALARFVKKDWEGLLDHFPECVEDMSDPLVKLLVEFASARLAADEVMKPDKKDQTLKNIRMVRNNLENLLDTLGEPG